MEEGGKRAVTILLVEDDDGHARLLERNLRRSGVLNRLVRVRDGQEALDYLHHAPPFDDPAANPVPSLVLLDVRMPRMDGFDFLAHIRRAGPLARLPVIMLTSTDNQREIDRAYELGANGYVVKPVQIESFIDRIRKLGMFLEIVEFPNRPSHDGSERTHRPLG
ncbi:MAG: response regulator [Candidatus Binatia bacterium]|nr:MAG: response regulator [Candidatus Binatia bacterium]